MLRVWRWRVGAGGRVCDSLALVAGGRRYSARAGGACGAAGGAGLALMGWWRGVAGGLASGLAGGAGGRWSGAGGRC